MRNRSNKLQIRSNSRFVHKQVHMHLHLHVSHETTLIKLLACDTLAKMMGNERAGNCGLETTGVVFNVVSGLLATHIGAPAQ